MNNKKVRTEWASLVLSDDGRVVVCINRDQSPHCILVKSLEQLKDAINTKAVSVKRWAIVVSKASCILKSVTLPTTDMAEAAKMVEFELPSLIPLPVDEISYGCTLLRKQENMVNVLVYIAKLKTLKQQLLLLKNSGIEPELIILDMLAVHSWFNIDADRKFANKICILATAKQRLIVTSVDGAFQHVYELNSFENDTTGSWQPAVQQILSEQSEMLSSQGKQPVISIAGIPELLSDLKKTLQIVPDGTLREYDLIENLLPHITDFDGNDLSEGRGDIAYEAVLAAGLLKLTEKPDWQYANILPLEYSRWLRHKTLRNNLILTGILGLLSILTLWLSLVSVNWRSGRLCAKIESRIAPIEHIASSVDSKREQAKAVLNQLSNRGLVTQIIKELYQYTPKGIYVSELKCTTRLDAASLEIKGQANLLSDAFEYANAMSKAKLLKPIQIINAQQIPRPGGSIVEFQASCNIDMD